MRTPGEDLFDSILDEPDSLPEGQPQSPPQQAVITVESSPTSPEPDGQATFSPISSPMEVSQEHEEFSIDALLSPGMVKRSGCDEDEMYVYEEHIQFFEAIKTSFKDKVGNPELSQAMVVEHQDQRMTTLLELAKVIKNLFKDIEEEDDEDRKFALHNLQLHSLPCIENIVDMVKTISTPEDLAIFYSNAQIKDKLVTPVGPPVGKNTARKLTFWTSEMGNLYRASNNYLYEVLKVDPKTMATKTIQAAKEAVAALVKENVMLKYHLKTVGESEHIYKELTLAKLNSIEVNQDKHSQESNELSARMINMETILQTWANRNPTRLYNEVASEASSSTPPDHHAKRFRTEPAVPMPGTSHHGATALEHRPLLVGQQTPVLKHGSLPANHQGTSTVEHKPLPEGVQRAPSCCLFGPLQASLQKDSGLQQGPPVAIQHVPDYGGQPGPIPNGPRWNHQGPVPHEAQRETSNGLHQGSAPRVQHATGQESNKNAPVIQPGPQNGAVPKPPPAVQLPGPPPPQWIGPSMIKNLSLFPMSSEEVKNEATLHISMEHIDKFGAIVEKIKTDLARKYPEQMGDLSSAYPSSRVEEHYHFVSYQLSLKRSFKQLHGFLNSNNNAMYDVNTPKFRFPLLRTGSRYQKALYDHVTKRMKSESNQALISVYCPRLARSIFIVEKAFQKKINNRFWLDSKEGVSESISSLSIMILILVESIMVDEETVKHHPNHESLQGFIGSPFQEDSGYNKQQSIEWATKGRNPNMRAIQLACGVSKTTFSIEIFKEAKIIAVDKNSTFLSGKERRAKSREESAFKRKAKGPSPSPQRDIPFWT